MKIYTRTGDDGTTSLAGGQRLPKHHPRIESYGTVDELIGWIGLLRSLPENKSRAEFLLSIQDKLMHCAAILASGPGASTTKMKAPGKDDIALLESSIDEMESQLQPLNSFILPGGNIAASYSNIARTVCRRTERSILRLDSEQTINKMLIKYINRLSDFLFVLSRLNMYESGATDSRWLP